MAIASTIGGNVKRPLPNGFSKLQYTPCFLHALKTLHVNQMTDMTGDFDDVVRARLHEVHGVARCTYQILCLDMRNKIAACTKWLDTSHQGPTFFSIGTTTFKPASAQAPVKRQHPAKISMMNDKPIVAVRTPVPKNSARVQASAEIFGSGSAAASAATSNFATGTFGSPVSPEHTVLTFFSCRGDARLHGERRQRPAYCWSNKHFHHQNTLPCSAVSLAHMFFGA